MFCIIFIVILAYNIITGALASAFGNYNIVKSDKQTVVGSFNDPSSTAYFVVGGGTSESTRKNVFTVDDSGNTNSAGTISAKKLEATSEVDTVLVLTDNLTVRNNLLLKYTSLSLTENTANGGTAYKEYSTGGCSTGIYVINITLTNSDKSGAGDTASCTILYDGGSKYHSSQVSFITGTVNKTDFTTTNYGIRLGNGMLKIYGTADKIHSVMLRKIAFLYS